MKKLKTIAVFCLAIVLFSFQQNGSSNDAHDPGDPFVEAGHQYTEVTVVYEANVTERMKEEIRNAEALELGSFQVVTCRSNPQVETWILDIPNPGPRDGSAVVVVLHPNYSIYWRGGPTC